MLTGTIHSVSSSWPQIVHLAFNVFYPFKKSQDSILIGYPVRFEILHLHVLVSCYQLHVSLVRPRHIVEVLHSYRHDHEYGCTEAPVFVEPSPLVLSDYALEDPVSICVFRLKND